MKITDVLLASLLVVLLLCNSISSKKSLKGRQPRVNSTGGFTAQDIRRIIKPYFQQPYHPKEVDSLAQELKTKPAEPMSTAQIVGDVERKTGFKERPSMYTTVIQPKETTITHHSIHGNSAIHVKSPKSNRPINEITHLARGQYAVPVRINTGQGFSDPTKADYDVPMFIQTKQSDFGVPMIRPSMNPLMNHFMKIAMGDISTVKQTLLSGNSIQNKINNLLLYRRQIKRDSVKLLESLNENIHNINNTKKINERLDRILEAYSKNENAENSQTLDAMFKDLQHKLSR